MPSDRDDAAKVMRPRLRDRRSAKNVIANVLTDRSRGQMWTEDAQAVLDALDAAGYVLIQLPEPDDTETDAAEWATSSALCARYWAGNPRMVSVWDKAHPWDQGASPISPIQARELAAALLAAADHAEGAQS